MKVLPVEGRLARDPVSRKELGKEGLEVSDSDSYWLRRLMDGDVKVEGPNPLEPEKTAEQPAPKEQE